MRPSLLVCLALAGCGDDDGGPVSPDGSADPAADAAVACPRAPAAADRPRKVVVSHPFADGDNAGNDYEVLELGTSGELATGGPTFEMGRSTAGRIVFTPDGEVGLVAQQDGTLGVFRFDEAGAPQVVHAAFTGSAYASGVVMDPSGERAFVLEFNTRANGGGVYAVAIGCDGTLTDEGLVVPAGVPGGMTLFEGRAYLAAADAADSPAGNEVHVFDWSATPVLVSGADLFGDDAILTDAAVTADGRWFMAGDNSLFSEAPNTVAIAEITATGVTLRQSVEIEDPVSIVTSPFGGEAIVASGFGDGAWVLRLEGATWSAAELDYQGESPQLPASAVVVERGGLTGRVLMGENVAVRQIQLSADTPPHDLGATFLGDGSAAITGAIGVQP